MLEKFHTWTYHDGNELPPKQVRQRIARLASAEVYILLVEEPGLVRHAVSSATF